MTMMWLEDLLQPTMVSPRARIWWAVFFSLFPLAYFGGIALEVSQQRSSRIVGSVDRAASISLAEQFAESKGYAVADWHQYAIVVEHENLMAYYENRKEPVIAAVRAMAPSREIQVLFRSPDQSHEFRVYLSLTGNVTGYDSGRSTDHSRSFSSNVGVVHVQTDTTSEHDGTALENASTKTSSEQDAESVARRAFSGNAALTKLIQLGPAKINRNSDDSSRYEVVWNEKPGNLKGLTVRVSASVRDSKMVAQHIEANVDQETVTKKGGLETGFKIVYGFFLAFATVYAIYRYAKRTLQKEVSHARTLVVAVLFAICFGILAYSLGVDQIASNISGSTFTKIRIAVYVTAGIVFAIMGLLVGIGYGSGEGELREAFPGKLTSLDALLSGRIFSRDVASSFLFGAAAAGWLVLIQHALGYFLQSDVDASQTHALSYTFAHLPRLTLVLGRQYDSLLIAVAGLLLPASFVSRRATRRHRRLAWLTLFALLAVFRDAAEYPTPALAVVAMFVLAAGLLFPFFSFDLLAGMVSLSALAFVNELVNLVEVVPSWTPFALVLAGLTAVALAIAAYLALRGQRVQEEDVRPQYARNLAERMAMQAEILAAREAQLRLLPQFAPELPGVQMAACCLPARGVGGDFYDFFRLDANRLGIFVAQGGDEGLASALCIALAKGVLMHASQQAHSPAQIIKGLEESIEELLERGSGSGISFAYGVMDSRLNLLKYARVGTSPRAVIYREGAGLFSSSPLEREVSEPGQPKGIATIYEGVAQVHPGDYLLFVTDGLMSLKGGRFGKRNYELLPSLVRELGKPEDPLQASLVAALSKYQKQASADLTAVVLRITEAQAVPQEVVA